MAHRMALRHDGLPAREAFSESQVAADVGLIAIVELAPVAERVAAGELVVDARDGIPEVRGAWKRNARAAHLHRHFVDVHIREVVVARNQRVNLRQEAQQFSTD